MGSARLWRRAWIASLASAGEVGSGEWGVGIGELGEEELFASLASAKLFSSLASASEGGGSGVAWPGAGLGDASQAVWVASSVARLSQS